MNNFATQDSKTRLALGHGKKSTLSIGRTASKSGPKKTGTKRSSRRVSNHISGKSSVESKYIQAGTPARSESELADDDQSPELKD